MVGYLYRVPSLGVLMKPISNAACFGYAGTGQLHGGSVIVVEAITDADWGRVPANAEEQDLDPNLRWREPHWLHGPEPKIRRFILR